MGFTYGGAISSEATLNQGLQLMELVMPFTTEEQVDFTLPIRQIVDVQDAYSHYVASEQVETLFQLIDEQGEPIQVELDNPFTWPTIAQRGDGSSIFGPANGQGRGVTPGALRKSLLQLGDIYKTPAQEDEEARRLVKLVQTQMANVSQAPKRGRDMPELAKILGEGGRSVDPGDKSKQIPDRLNSMYRKTRLALVGEDGDAVADGACGRLNSRRKFCLRHNLPTIVESLSSLSEEEVLTRMQQGTLSMDNDLMDKLDYAEEDQWFCPLCAPPSDRGGNVLLVATPDSLLECPGCNHLCVVPAGGVLLACPMCPITYGLGTVKKSDLVIFKTRSEAELQLTAVRQRYTYLRTYWGSSKLCKGLKYETALAELTKSILDPDKTPRYRYNHQKSGRHHKYQLGAFHTMDGLGGLHGRDYQVGRPTPKTSAQLKEEVKKADKEGPPLWDFKLTSPPQHQIMVIEAAFKEAFDDVVNTHGDGAKQDPVAIWEACHNLTSYSASSEEWTPNRREVLLQSMLVDFSDRIGTQQSDWSRDMRYDHEKPGSIRLQFYENSYNYLHYVEEPMERGGRTRTAEEVFGVVSGFGKKKEPRSGELKTPAESGGSPDAQSGNTPLPEAKPKFPPQLEHLRGGMEDMSDIKAQLNRLTQIVGTKAQ